MALYSSNSPFTILDGATPAGEALINQRSGPNDFIADGSTWEFLGGPVDIFSSTLTVRLTNAGADGYVLADAIRIKRLGPTNDGSPAESNLFAGDFVESAPLPAETLRAGPLPADFADETLFATGSGDDGLDDLAASLAHRAGDLPSADLDSNSAASGRTARCEDKAFDLALADWLG